jgi:hypothetical protein
MKCTTIILSLLCLITQLTQAQAPQGIPYQAAARNANGSILASQNISLRFTIHDSTAAGTIVYQESNSTLTNAQGMFAINIGMGYPIIGTFNNINWGNNAKFMKVEMDQAGGNNYLDMGTQQMMSVPYALYAKTAGNTSSSNLPPGGADGQVLTITNGNPQWGNFSLILTIGMYYQGGVIAYVYQPGDPGFDVNTPHGIIAAPVDQGSYAWNDSSYIWYTNANGISLGTGKSNTDIIVANQGAGSYAAKICNDLMLNGYNDWYLPSKDELSKIYINSSVIPGLQANGMPLYWSSTEANSDRAWFCHFSLLGNYYNNPKNTYCNVRAIRSF